MKKPTIAVIDANACIIHALDLGKIHGRQVHDIDCKFVRCFVNGCIREKIRTGTFPTMKKLSYNNVTKATIERVRRSGVRESYVALKWRDLAKGNLDKLFRQLAEFPESFTEEQLDDALLFFKSIQKDLTSPSGREKSPIPEREDLQLFVNTHNLWSDKSHIVSNDRHFTHFLVARV